MTHAERLEKLALLGWQIDETAGRHKICNEPVTWIMGDIAGVAHSAWMADVSGMVYLHMIETTPGEYDFTFDTFCVLVRDGWPKPKAAPATRGFDFGD